VFIKSGLKLHEDLSKDDIVLYENTYLKIQEVKTDVQKIKLTFENKDIEVDFSKIKLTLDLEIAVFAGDSSSLSIVQVDIRETGVELAWRLLSGEPEDSERVLELFWKGKKLEMETKFQDLGILNGDKMVGLIIEEGGMGKKHTTVHFF
jgi:hypothetical protein